MNKLIAFTGKKGTGKSTACQYLESKYDFTRVNFKDGLIAELKQNFHDLLRAIAYKEYSESFIDEVGISKAVEELFIDKEPLARTLMQNYGTNVRRNDNQDYWVSKWTTKVRSLQGNSSQINITVDDCRFLNEAQAIKDRGGIIIRLDRDDMEHTDNHISETEMDSIVPDYTINCVKGDLDKLHKELDRIYEHISSLSFTTCG